MCPFAVVVSPMSRPVVFGLNKPGFTRSSLVLAVCSILYATTSVAGPQGGQVVGGQATIDT